MEEPRTLLLNLGSLRSTESPDNWETWSCFLFRLRKKRLESTDIQPVKLVPLSGHGHLDERIWRLRRNPQRILILDCHYPDLEKVSQSSQQIWQSRSAPSTPYIPQMIVFGWNSVFAVPNPEFGPECIILTVTMAVNHLLSHSRRHLQGQRYGIDLL